MLLGLGVFFGFVAMGSVVLWNLWKQIGQDDPTNPFVWVWLAVIGSVFLVLSVGGCFLVASS